MWMARRGPERDRLNDYWNALNRGAPPEELARLAEPLDPTVIAAIDRARALHRRRRPAPAFANRLERDLMNAFATAPAGSIPLRPTPPGPSNGRTAPRARPNWLPSLPASRERRRWALAQLSTAILLIVTLLGLYFTLHENRPAIGPGTPMPGTPPPATPSTDVPMYRGDAARTGVMPGPGPDGQPTELWRFQAQGPVERQPAVVDGVVYVGSGDGVLHALDAASGAERWRYAAGGRSGVTVPIDGVLYGATNQGVAFALDAATGTERWRQQVTTVNLRGPAVADGVLYFGSDDGTLYTLDAATGAARWTFASGWGLIVTPTVADGAIYLSARNDETLQGELISVDAATGQERWRFKTPSGAALWPATVADGVAYAGGWDGTVYALDAATGVERWRAPTGVNQLHGAPVLVGDTLYEGAEDRAVYAFDAATGTMRWRFPVDGDLGELAVASGVLYVGTNFGFVYAIGGSDVGVGLTAPVVAGSTPATRAATPATGQAAGAPTGPVQFLWQTTGGPEPLLPPTGVAVAPDGNLWVVDGANNRFQIFAPDGTFLEAWGPRARPRASSTSSGRRTTRPTAWATSPSTPRGASTSPTRLTTASSSSTASGASSAPGAASGAAMGSSPTPSGWPSMRRGTST